MPEATFFIVAQTFDDLPGSALAIELLESHFELHHVTIMP